MNEPQWLTLARALQAHAQNGLAYSRDPFDLERFHAIRRIALEIMATYTDADLSSLIGLFDGETGYATPKIDVRAAVFKDDAILMVRERTDGGWSLPGGWADVGESPSEMAAREVFEESGYRVRAMRLLAVYDRNRHGHPPIPFYVYKLIFQCELTGGAPVESIETDGIGFFREDALPELSLSRVTPGQLRRIFEHYRHPDWPADFD
ncbi:MAG: NUDIX hydrolase [Chloroflexi bacterium]|nr:NUDIX hydrolase [Chloroflexota bacterium]MCL5275296.1 NUDIX hydrolase [Chloroflexota bacterium]